MCFGGEPVFERQQIRDKIKVEYCAKNNIPLLVIPYWDFKKIEKIVDEFINNLPKKIKPKPVVIRRTILPSSTTNTETIQNFGPISQIKNDQSEFPTSNLSSNNETIISEPNNVHTVLINDSILVNT